MLEDYEGQTVLCEICRINVVPEELLNEMVCYDCFEVDQIDSKELDFNDGPTKIGMRYWPQQKDNSNEDNSI